MGLSTRSVRSDPLTNSVSLLVEQNGLNVTVRAGSFVIAGTSYELSQDQVYTHVSDSLKMWVSGCLAKNRATNVVQLFVDEVKDDGVDTHYRFLDTDPYELLHRLFNVEIPANTPSLNSLDVQVTPVVALS